MISSEKAERKRFELWYNNHYDMELITGPDDVDAAWEVWKAALADFPVNAIGYVELSNEGEPTRFRTGRFGGGHPIYLSPVSAAMATTDSARSAWNRFQALLSDDDPAAGACERD